MTNICKNCKNVQVSFFLDEQFSECMLNYVVNPVTGEELYIKCSFARSELGHCGVSGRFFDPKPTLKEKVVSWFKVVL